MREETWTEREKGKEEEGPGGVIIDKGSEIVSRKRGAKQES